MQKEFVALDKRVVNGIEAVCRTILGGEVTRATKYLDERYIVRATRKRYQGKFAAKNQNIELTLTIGRPNYAEREFIKTCLKAGEPFPIKKVQVKEYNPKRKKLLKSK